MGGYGSMVAQGIVDRANEIHADNKQKKDEEHARKISDLILERQDLVNKIPTLQQGTPEYDEAHKQLQGVIGDIVDVYHPQKNPGAIEKFGHLLTDHLKLTNPQERAQKESAQQQARTSKIAGETDRQIAAAPLSAAQINTQKVEAQLKEIDASNLDDEGKKAARAKVFGVTTAVKPNWQQFKLPNGTLRSYDLNKPDEIPEGASEVAKGAVTTAKENIAGFDDAVSKGYKGSFPRWIAEQRRLGAPSTSAANLYAASYQRAYGIKPEDMTPQDWDFILRKQAYDKAIPQTTTANTLKQNFQEQWVPIQETNTKSPGGPAPMPPRGKPLNNTPPPSREDISIAEAPASPAQPQGGATPAGTPPVQAAPTAGTPPAAAAPRTMVVPNPKGLVEAGNIPIDNRPSIQNADGKHSSEFSTSFEQDGNEILVPTIVDGKFLTPDGKKPKEGSDEEKAMFAAAEDHYNKTGQHLGKFKTAADANAYAEQLHNRGGAGDKKPAPSVRELKKEAETRRPTAPSSDSSPTPRSGGGANASVKVGDPIMAAPSKEYRDAKQAYHGAIERVSTMEKNLKSALNSNPPNQQAMLSLVANHIGMTLGAQKGARINQAVWNEAVASAPYLETIYAKMFHTDPQTGDHVLDGWKSGVTLTPDQMKQMVELAHERKDTLEQSLKTIENDLNAGVTNPSKRSAVAGSGSGGETKKHKIKIGSKFYTYNGTGDTADIKNYTEVKEK